MYFKLNQRQAIKTVRSLQKPGWEELKTWWAARQNYQRVASQPTELNIALCGIDDKPGIVDWRIEIREYLNVTISLDHDIIDDAPAARFTQRFIELIESAFGMSE